VASEAKDPREATMLSLQRNAMDVGKAEVAPQYRAVVMPTPEEALADLDAADPLRAMLGEVVEALERVENVGWVSDDGRFVARFPPNDGRYWRALILRDSIQPIHARLRTATEGGTDDGN
jgi:hypothetical protein